MTNKHNTDISVRYHDCDPYRHLNTANYLRYMVESDLADYEARGHGLEELANRGEIWLARRCFAEFLTPLYYGDQIRVAVHTRGIDGALILKAYQIYSSGSERPAAVGEILWELADLKSGVGEKIPEDVKADLFPDAAEGIPLMDFPASLSTRPQGAFAVQRFPEWRDGGPGYHLSFTAYADYFVYTTLQAAASRGWSIARSEEERIAYVVRRLWIDFLKPVFVWDELELETWISNLRRFTVLRNYSMRRNGGDDLLAWGQFLYACVNMDSGKPIRFPQSIWKDFAPQISPDDLPGGGESGSY